MNAAGRRRYVDGYGRTAAQCTPGISFLLSTEVEVTLAEIVRLSVSAPAISVITVNVSDKLNTR